MTWYDKDEPWWDDDEYIDKLMSSVPILELLDFFKVSYYNCSSGDFTHRTKCPFQNHKHGDERTPSFYISEKNNSFYCFGCQGGTSIIDFVCLYRGMPFYKSVEFIYNFKNKKIVAEPKKRKSRKKTIITQTYEAGIMIRDFVKDFEGTNKHNKWKKWADEKFDRLDKYLDKLNDDDWEMVKNYKEELKKFIDKNKR